MVNNGSEEDDCFGGAKNTLQRDNVDHPAMEDTLMIGNCVIRDQGDDDNDQEGKSKENQTTPSMDRDGAILGSRKLLDRDKVATGTLRDRFV